MHSRHKDCAKSLIISTHETHEIFHIQIDHKSNLVHKFSKCKSHLDNAILPYFWNGISKWQSVSNPGRDNLVNYINTTKIWKIVLRFENMQSLSDFCSIFTNISWSRRPFYLQSCLNYAHAPTNSNDMFVKISWKIKICT